LLPPPGICDSRKRPIGNRHGISLGCPTNGRKCPWGAIVILRRKITGHLGEVSLRWSRKPAQDQTAYTQKSPENRAFFYNAVVYCAFAWEMISRTSVVRSEQESANTVSPRYHLYTRSLAFAENISNCKPSAPKCCFPAGPGGPPCPGAQPE